ncbi:MAG: hypothetical protein A2138_26630 [Deltaproteobacteria bacterium RBG_16_71_12]|nr:MAG: hypothetical protein A2138_26630 [Deltaproteobacteria bacterium RBG_16_71_12]
MANEIQKPVRRFPWVTPSGQSVGAGGVSADEMRIHQGQKPLSPDVAPIAQRAPVEFISPSTSSESLRLAVPEAANPFATPTGPRHDHMMIRQVLQRAGGDASKALTNALKNLPAGVKPEDGDRMRASASREHNMLQLLKGLQDMQEHIYARIVGLNRDV